MVIFKGLINNTERNKYTWQMKYNQQHDVNSIQGHTTQPNGQNNKTQIYLNLGHFSNLFLFPSLPLRDCSLCFRSIETGLLSNCCRFYDRSSAKGTKYLIYFKSISCCWMRNVDISYLKITSFQIRWRRHQISIWQTYWNGISVEFLRSFVLFFFFFFFCSISNTRWSLYSAQFNCSCE